MRAAKIFMRNIIYGLLFLSFATALPADTVVEEIVARVNNQIITRSEYQRNLDDLKQEAQQDPSTADKAIAQGEKDILREMIDQQLLLEKGKDLAITADTELVKKLDEMRKEMKLDSIDELEKAAQAQGVSFEDFKQKIRNQIITQQVIGKEVGSRLAISKDEEKEFYDNHKDELAQPEQVKLSEILVSTDKGAGDEDARLAAAKAKADDLLEQIRKGAGFSDVAKKNSDGPTAAQGGDLGYFKRGALAKELEDITFGLKTGDASAVIRTKQGFVILKVTDHQRAGIPSMNEIEPRIQDALYMQKLQPALREYLKRLREEAFIYRAPGYVDTGASPNETQPVETNSKVLSAKQLKKKKKFGVF
jgi:peptidyl-prolyl cis-trans isomerase SurA